MAKTPHNPSHSQPHTPCSPPGVSVTLPEPWEGGAQRPSCTSHSRPIREQTNPGQPLIMAFPRRADPSQPCLCHPGITTGLPGQPPRPPSPGNDGNLGFVCSGERPGAVHTRGGDHRRLKFKHLLFSETFCSGILTALFPLLFTILSTDKQALISWWRRMGKCRA